MAIPELYKAWWPEAGDTEDTALVVDAIDTKGAARLYASWRAAQVATEWPIVITVLDPKGKRWLVQVDREVRYEYTVSKVWIPAR
jgi:hypothetical protein